MVNIINVEPKYYILILILGIVIKYEHMSYRTAVHHAHLVLSLCGKASKYLRDLFEPPDVNILNLYRLSLSYLCFTI